jgi:hypothetical protein
MRYVEALEATARAGIKNVLVRKLKMNVPRW